MAMTMSKKNKNMKPSIMSWIIHDSDDFNGYDDYDDNEDAHYLENSGTI